MKAEFKNHTCEVSPQLACLSIDYPLFSLSWMLLPDLSTLPTTQCEWVNNLYSATNANWIASRRLASIFLLFTLQKRWVLSFLCLGQINRGYVKSLRKQGKGQLDNKLHVVETIVSTSKFSDHTGWIREGVREDPSLGYLVRSDGVDGRLGCRRVIWSRWLHKSDLTPPVMW